MIKYALLLPLVLLSFLLGYFASNSQKEQVYAVALLATGFVTAVGYLFFVRNQKQSNRKQVTRTATTIGLLFLFSALIGMQFVQLANANPVPVYSLTMPEEYIDYTICLVNGSLWAKVDGTYPLNKVDIECQNMADTWFTFSGNTLRMVYPTPPRTTSISLKMDETELEWSNYTQTVPDATHFTAIGNWPMISCAVYPVLDQFTLKIYYEHPIIQKNGSYTFLYDLNISPYLSQWSNMSTAHFNIRFETGITDLQINTISVDGRLNPVNYTVTKENKIETVSLQVVSAYSKSLPGDLIISFKENKEPEQSGSGFLGSSSPTEHVYVLVVVVAVTLVAVILVVYRRGLKKHKTYSTE
jgi:hypothetical protein